MTSAEADILHPFLLLLKCDTFVKLSKWNITHPNWTNLIWTNTTLRPTNIWFKDLCAKSAFGQIRLFNQSNFDQLAAWTPEICCLESNIWEVWYFFSDTKLILQCLQIYWCFEYSNPITEDISPQRSHFFGPPDFASFQKFSSHPKSPYHRLFVPL